MEWGERMWLALQQIELVNQGGANHKLHLKNKHKQQLLQPIRHLLKRPKTGSNGDRATAVLGFSAAKCEWYFEGSNRDGDQAGSSSESQSADTASSSWHSSGSSRQQPFRVLGDEEVEQIFPGLTPTWQDCHFEQLPAELLEQMDDLNVYDKVNSDSEEEEEQQQQQQQQQGDIWEEWKYDDLRFTAADIVNDLAEDKVVVAEVMDLHHPVRYCAAPGQPTYTLLAKQDVKAGEALVDYIGQYKLGKDAKYEDDIEQGREEPGPGEPPHKTACARVVWNQDINRPVVRLYALRDMEQGEEVAVDYTASYWLPLGKALMAEQHKYARQALLQHEQLDRELQQALQQNLLSRQQVDAAISYNPDLNQIQTYTP